MCIRDRFTIVPLYVVAYQIGRLVTGEGAGFVNPPEFDWAHSIDWSQAMLVWILGMGKPLGIGLPLLALGLALIGYFLTQAVWRIYLVRAWQHRQKRNSALKS